MARLAVEGLTKRFGRTAAVDDVSFEVKEGEFLVVVGPSGCGKTTTLRMVVGLESITEGSIRFGDLLVNKIRPRDRNVAMVFQDYAIFPHMSVFENIAYGQRSRGAPRNMVQERVPLAAQTFRIDHLLKRKPKQLSGGERQRVALARAMAKDADIYLYDEPLSNLDPKLRFQARHDIMKVHRLKGQPSLYVTHDQNEAFTMADRIGVVGGGKLQQVGTPDELLQAPTNLFMAHFIGSPPMNLLRGKLSRDNGLYRLGGDGFALELPPRFNDALTNYRGDRLVLGIRPEGVLNARGDDEAFEVVATEVEPLVGETAVMFSLGSGGLYAVFQDNEQDAAVVVQEGATMRLRFDPDRLCLFDPETERALGA